MKAAGKEESSKIIFGDDPEKLLAKMIAHLNKQR